VGDLFEAGATWLAGQLKQHASQEVTYSRGGGSVVLRATAGPQPLRLTGQYGAVTVEWSNTDWVIPAADLVIGGQQATPEPGDKIRRVMGGVVYVFEVLAPRGEPVWRYSDAHRAMIRVHTKQVGVE
jgi:hypothetical protein